MSFEYERDRNKVSGISETAQHFAAVLNLWSMKQASGSTPQSADWIYAAIETEIVPRLVLANELQKARPPLPEIAPKEITDNERHAFLASLLHESASDAHLLARQMVMRGVPLEAVYIDLLAWSARRLGEYWEEDLCNFTDVTIGLCRLHEAMHHLRDFEASPPVLRRAAERHILIGNAPGEQHVFGAVMVAEFFRRDGWMVSCEPGSPPESLCKLAASRDFDVIGLSASSDSAVGRLSGLIASLRSVSRNPEVRVMAGGPVFAQNQLQDGGVGADLIAVDGLQAPQIARKLLAMSQ